MRCFRAAWPSTGFPKRTAWMPIENLPRLRVRAVSAPTRQAVRPKTRGKQPAARPTKAIDAVELRQGQKRENPAREGWVLARRTGLEPTNQKGMTRNRWEPSAQSTAENVVAGSGHAFDTSERHADSRHRDSTSLAAWLWRFREWPRAVVTSRNHSAIRECSRRLGQRR